MSLTTLRSVSAASSATRKAGSGAIKSNGNEKDFSLLLNQMLNDNKKDGKESR